MSSQEAQRQWFGSTGAKQGGVVDENMDARLDTARILCGSAQAAAVMAGAGWMAVSSGLIMLNKHLMSTDGFHFPMALSGLGMVFSSVASYLACRVRARPAAQFFWLNVLVCAGTFHSCALCWHATSLSGSAVADAQDWLLMG